MGRTKRCPRCDELVKAAARACRYCGHEFAVDEVEAEILAEQRAGMLKAGIVLAALLGVAWCASSSDEAPSAVPLAVEAASSYTPAPPIWNYYRSVDVARNAEIVGATLRSLNYNEFDWPYSGKTYLTMAIRQHPAYGLDVFFQVDQGQILCRSYSEPCHGLINVDGKVERLTLTEPDDLSSDVVFATYDVAILNKLKAAKRIVVELPIYQEGNRQWTFSTAGLKWPPE